MAKWIEFYRITTLEILKSRCPLALWVFPKPKTCRCYKEPITGDIVFEKLAEIKGAGKRKKPEKS